MTPPPAPARPSAAARGRRLSAAAAAVFVVVAVAAGAAAAVTRDLVRENERDLLDKRAAEVSALLSNSVASTTSDLRVLGVLAAEADLGSFELAARSVARTLGSAVVLLEAAGEAYTVASAVGNPGPPSDPSGAGRSGLAARASESGQLVADLIAEGAITKVAFALAAPAPARAVVVSEVVVDPARPLSPSQGSAFSDMRGAVYASPAVDPARLVLTTESELPITGRAVERPFVVGAERWTLVVGVEQPLTGWFAQRAPWLLLAVGLLVALLAGAVVQGVARRHQFAGAVVRARTAELESTRSFLERLLLAGPMVVVRADRADDEPRLSYVSPNVERVFGLAPDVLRATSLLAFVHPADVEAARAALSRGDGEAGTEPVELRLRHGDGSYRWVSSVTVPDAADGAAPALFVYMTDITPQREAEEALRAAQQGAEAANRSKSEFLSRMSHELRTPLNSILGFGQVLAMHPLAPDQVEAVDQILRGGHHLLDPVDEVLDISRIETGRLPLSPEAVEVAEVVGEALELVRPMAAQRGITLVDRVSTESHLVVADRQRLKQVLLNLLSNAVKYNRLGGTVVVACSEAGAGHLRLSVADTGPGIPAEQMDRLFVPFDRLSASGSEVEGTGIGLTLSRSLTEAMGGRVWADSAPGEGSTFSVELPRAESPVKLPERSRRGFDAVATRPEEGEEEPGRRHTVLYIEDNISNIKLMEHVLKRRRDLELVSAIQGRLGVELARQHRPTLILLDLHLPDARGEDILEELRRDPTTAAVPVVIVTADATSGHVQRLLSAGATGYLTKPLDVAALLRVVDDLVPVS